MPSPLIAGAHPLAWMLAMDFDLVVSVPFGAYAAGARITDPVAIATILASPNALYVVRVSKAGPSGEESAPVPRILVGDEILLRRNREDRLIEIADFEAFQLRAGGPIATAIGAGGGTGTPSGLSPIVASLIFG